MVERVSNVIEQDSKKVKRNLLNSPEEIPKKKRGVELLRRYPVNSDCSVDSDNAESLEQHNNAISTELKKAKPRDSISLKSTYGERHIFVLNEAESVCNILERYPAPVSCKYTFHTTHPLIHTYSLAHTQHTSTNICMLFFSD